MTTRKKNTETAAEMGTVVGLFRHQPDAERAIRELRDAGFADDQIGVLMRDRDRQQELAKGTGSKAGEGAATGAVSGGVVGGVLGLLAGIGALAIPGIGPIVAGGALASTLAGAGIGAAAGGLIGALVGMGVPEEEARYYDQAVREGGILVTVYARQRAIEARRILRDCRAEFGPMADVAYAGEGKERLELREEDLRAAKERVQTGEARVRKEVVSEEKTIDVPVTREEVVVERRPVSGRPAAGADLKEGEEIRIPVTEEKVRVEKTPVVKEEVTVGKRRVQETERVRDTVRREEVRVEEEGDAHLRERGEPVPEPWRGSERRYHDEESYHGPERRRIGAR
jgi:uncharacterized protein (TIGR02271 family)